MDEPQIHCRLFQSFPNETFSTTRLDHVIREVDPESDPGMVRLLERLRTILVKRSLEARLPNRRASYPMTDRWPH